jgi:PAS domain S-box-containing protein
VTLPAHEALHASTYKALFETAPDAMVVCDAAGRIVLINPQGERLFGYSGNALAGQPIETLIPERARSRHHHHRAHYVAHPRVRPMGTGQDLTGLRADGSEFPVEIALSPIDSVDGSLFVASIRDISETQRARQALARSRYDAVIADIGQLMLRSANQDGAFDGIPLLLARELDAAAVAIVHAQPETGTVRVRAAAGMKPQLEELLPELLSAEILVMLARTADASVLRYRTDVESPSPGLRALAEAGYADFVAAPLFDRARPMGALIAAHRTDTFDNDRLHLLQSVAILLASTMQRNRTEEQLAHAQRLEAIGQLTGGVAHDFNNMLTVISGNLQLLEMELEDRPANLEILGSALRAVGRGSGLTRKLLAIAGRQRLDPQPIDPRRLVNELAPMLTRTLGQTIEVEVSCPEDVAEVFVDPGELDTAILNLALNARDAMPRGGTLQLSVREQMITSGEAGVDLDPGNYVVITVQDTGIGMTPEVLARAFEPFFTTKDIGRGSGLGLSMVYGFVKQSGGHLTADSRLGYGTRIELMLPAVRGTETRAAPKPAPGSRGGVETVLVVEDEADVRAVAIAFLRSLGYATLDAGDAAQALELLQRHPEISLLFSDVVLGSGMTGNELARAAIRLRPGLPALLASGYEHSAVKDADAPKFPLLRKPYQREQLAAAIRAVLDGAAS